MPNKIHEDHEYFIDIVKGLKRKSIKKFIDNGKVFRLPRKNGKIHIPIPSINNPYIVHGENKNDASVGRGQGKKGQIVGRAEPDDDEGSGEAGEGESEGIEIAVDLDEMLFILQDELSLPNPKPKINQIYDEVKIKYNNISLIGPESLRHNRRTMFQALKRQIASGEFNKLHTVPGFAHPVRLIMPIRRDKRYRQYREIKLPASNAVIFFARDGSGSMTDEKCDVVSDMAWWIDAWIRRFYKRVECCYIWHDSVAKEVDRDQFYRLREGGGTACSSAMKLIAKQFENRFLPSQWNIYVFYFTDGDNWGDDNNLFCEIVQKHFTPEVVNFFGTTQVMPWGSRYHGTIKELIDDNLKQDNIKTTSINGDDVSGEIRSAIRDLLGNNL